MPKRAIALVAGIVAFAVIVLSIAAWAGLSGRAGSQRGLVIHTELPQDVVVRLEDGQAANLGPNGAPEHAFVVRRDQFPSKITVVDPQGALVFERLFKYSDLADAEFRLSIDRNGFYPTTAVRDTPVPTP
ncbi:MAG TPA: hypothetical protein VIH21_12550 [Dehalococcoidia bacterium]